MQKGLTPILIVIIIALALGGFLIYQKQTKPLPLAQQVTQISPTSSATTTDPTVVHMPSDSETSSLTGEFAGWLTYTNKDYGYMINYPPKWILVSEGGDAHYIKLYDTVSTKFSQVSPNNPPGSYFAISVIKASANSSLEEWLKENNSTDQQGVSVSIDSTKAFKYSHSDIMGDLGKDSFLVWTKKGDKVYKIISVSFEGYEAPVGNIYSQMLSTFKFTQ